MSYTPVNELPQVSYELIIIPKAIRKHSSRVGALAFLDGPVNLPVGNFFSNVFCTD